MKKKINRIINNKLFLFIIPNLIYCYTFLYFYNNNFRNYITRTEVLLTEVIILISVGFLLYLIIYLILKYILKDEKKIFCISHIIVFFYFYKFNIFTFLVFIILITFITLLIKKYLKANLDKLVCVLSIILIFMFSNQFIILFYNISYSFFNTKSYDYEINFNIANNTLTPNIYWIHCDGMMNFNTIEKYYNYDNEELKKYYKDNNFEYKKDTTLVAGHRTQTSLNAMFNPKYYDEFFGNYLNKLEKSFINKKDSSFIVDYYELEEKRYNNELLKSLKEKKYTTIAIADFNQYTGMKTDYFYDFYNEHKNKEISKEFRYMNLTNQNDKKLLSYIRFNHFKPLLKTISLFPLLRNINYLDYKVLDYGDNEISNYYYINNSIYWQSKAILAGINDTTKIKNQKFVFIDYKLNHYPVYYDKNGNYISEKNRYTIDSYLGNYIYSTKILTEILEYIKEEDNNAIIFVQGDHGIHMFDDEKLKEYFNITQEELQTIRNSVINAYYIPNKYKNGNEKYLNNPLNISRYIINNFVGENYEYIK